MACDEAAAEVDPSALTTALLAAPPLHGQRPLDRIRQKAEETADSVRDVRNGVEDIANADERAVAETEAAQRGVQREVESATDVEGQARRAAADSELGRSTREGELEAARIGTTDRRIEQTDERAQADAERRVNDASTTRSASALRSAHSTISNRPWSNAGFADLGGFALFVRMP